MDPSKIWSSTTLPTLPAAAVKLLEMSRNPETEIRDIADVIKRDPALSAKILKSANSTFFGLSSKVSSVDRAVPLLGTTLVTSMALSFSLSESAMSDGPMAEYYKDYWWQSVVQASAAECCAVILADRSAGPEFFQAGLLMDLGRLA
ncbi:MAG: HDOD domain-containing protein, partial [Planctomycetaceae bacterium]|nr:HDOD domain-containing protein [Planctomycetaceae bacterium]